jgi:ABC-type enterochelin transport system permease subunit
MGYHSIGIFLVIFWFLHTLVVDAVEYSVIELFLHTKMSMVEVTKQARIPRRFGRVLVKSSCSLGLGRRGFLLFRF